MAESKLPLRKLDLFSTTFTVCVGPQKQAFILHNAVASRTSKYFASAFNGRWNEAEAKGVTLPDQDANYFSIYAYWMYFRKIDLLDESNITTQQLSDVQFARYAYTRLLNLYILGEYFLDISFRNAIIDSVISLYSRHTEILPGISEIQLIWSQIPHECSMKRLMTTVWANTIRPEEIPATTAGYPDDFCASVIKHLAGLRDKAAALPTMKLAFHYHEQDETAVDRAGEASAVASS